MVQTRQVPNTESHPGRDGWRWRTRAGALLLTVAAMLTGMLVAAAPASADVAVDQVLCRNGARGAPTLSASSVPWGTTVTVTWHTTLPAVCSNGGVNPRFFIRALGSDPATETSNGVGPNGSMTFDAALSTTVSLDISAGETRTLGGARLAVDPYVPTHLEPGTTVGVSDNSLTSRRRFVQAVQSPDTVVWVGGNVELNLSGLNEILVAPGVKIMGDRSLSPRGPRLFTYTFPNRLFYIGSSDGPSDNVRITGIRFDGHEPSDPCQSAEAPTRSRSPSVPAGTSRSTTTSSTAGAAPASTSTIRRRPALRSVGSTGTTLRRCGCTTTTCTTTSTPRPVCPYRCRAARIMAPATASP